MMAEMENVEAAFTQGMALSISPSLCTPGCMPGCSLLMQSVCVGACSPHRTVSPSPSSDVACTALAQAQEQATHRYAGREVGLLDIACGTGG